jgi:hypothetical protein
MEKAERFPFRRVYSLYTDRNTARTQPKSGEWSYLVTSGTLLLRLTAVYGYARSRVSQRMP